MLKQKMRHKPCDWPGEITNCICKFEPKILMVSKIHSAYRSISSKYFLYEL